MPRYAKKAFRLRHKKKAKTKLAKVAKKVNTLMEFNKPEYKQYTVYLNAAGTMTLNQTAQLSSTGAPAFGQITTNLTPVGTRGTDYNEFIGNEFYIHYIDINMIGHVGNGLSPLRLTLFKSRAGTLETPTAATIFENNSVLTLPNMNNDCTILCSDLNTDYFYDRRLINNGTKADKRYEKIYDAVIPVGNIKDLKFRKRFHLKPPCKITQSIADVMRGSTLWCSVFPGYSTTAANNPLWAGSCTMYFTDS